MRVRSAAISSRCSIPAISSPCTFLSAEAPGLGAITAWPGLATASSPGSRCRRPPTSIALWPSTGISSAKIAPRKTPRARLSAAPPSSRSRHAMPAMGREQDPVALAEFAVGLLAFDAQARPSLQPTDPFIGVLIVPLAFTASLDRSKRCRSMRKARASRQAGSTTSSGTRGQGKLRRSLPMPQSYALSC